MHQSTKLGRALAALAITVGVAAYPVVSHADEPNPNPGTSVAQVMTGTGTVQKIDKDKRVITIKGDKQGNEIEAKVAPNVNIDKIKVGDHVSAAYYEEVAVSLRKQGEQPPKMTQTVTERGGVTAEQTTVTAKIVAVDMDKKEVTVRGPSGTNHELKVEDPSLQAQLGNIKPGDNVDVTYTQAIAVAITPMNPMKK